MPSFFDPAAPKAAPRPPRQLISDLMFPELDRQLSDDPALWPNLNGLYILNVTRRKKPASTWYLLFQGNKVKPVITKLKQASRQASGKKVPVVKLQLEDGDVLNFVAGGLTGVKAYMARRIKVQGDLVLAQRLEKLFEKAGGRERAMQFVQQNEHLFGLSATSKL